LDPFSTAEKGGERRISFPPRRIKKADSTQNPLLLSPSLSLSLSLILFSRNPAFTAALTREGERERVGKRERESVSGRVREGENWPTPHFDSNPPRRRMFVRPKVRNWPLFSLFSFPD
jgi:hypothetical protein